MTRASVLLIFALASATLLAQTTGASSASQAAPRPDTKLLVLQPPDLPARFKRLSGHYESNAQASARTKRNFTALGRLNGYTARFETTDDTGVLYLDSDASAYKSAALAHTSFLGGARIAESRKDPAFRRVSLISGIGSEARLYATTIAENGVEMTVYLVAWRSGPIIASLVASARPGTSAAGVVALAARQQFRIAAATR